MLRLLGHALVRLPPVLPYFLPLVLLRVLPRFRRCWDGVWFNAHSTGSSVDGTRQVCAADGFDIFGRGGLLFLGDSDLDLWSATSSSYFDTFPNSSSLAVGGYTCDDVLDDDIEDVLDEASPSTVRIHAPTYLVHTHTTHAHSRTPCR